jgi:hypothetical protein
MINMAPQLLANYHTGHKKRKLPTKQYVGSAELDFAVWSAAGISFAVVPPTAAAAPSLPEASRRCTGAARCCSWPWDLWHRCFLGRFLLA